MVDATCGHYLNALAKVLDIVDMGNVTFCITLRTHMVYVKTLVRGVISNQAPVALSLVAPLSSLTILGHTKHQASGDWTSIKICGDGVPEQPVKVPASGVLRQN